MAVTVVEFKRAFADQGAQSPLNGRTGEVERTLNRLKRAVDELTLPEGDSGEFKKSLVELITRYKSAKQLAEKSPDKSAAELHEILHLSEGLLGRMKPAAEDDPRTPGAVPDQGGSSTAQGIDIDPDVIQARFLQSWFENPDPKMADGKGAIAGELLQIAERLERRLAQAPRNESGLPVLAGKIQWDTKSSSAGKLEDIAPFAARDQWTAASAAAPQSAGKRGRKGKVSVYVTLPSTSAVIGMTEIGHATVRIGNITKRTDVNGHARFSLPLGWHVCVASAEGYQETAMPFLAMDDLGMNVPLFPLGAPSWLQETIDDPRPSLSLLVQSGRDRLKGATVKVGDVSTSTGGGGLATFPIEPGRYAYEISAAGHEPETGRFDVPNEPWVIRVIELFRSKAGVESQVTVRVKSGIDGHRIESAEVMFGDEFKLTDRDGEATFEAVTQKVYPYDVEFDRDRFGVNKGEFEVRKPKEVFEFVLQPRDGGDQVRGATNGASGTTSAARSHSTSH